jgi:phosphatidate cytidylyltransferase
MVKTIYDRWMQIPPPVAFGFLAIFAVLVLGSVAGEILPRLNPSSRFKDVRQRVKSWWVIVILLAGALVLGWQAITVLFALTSFLALREFLSLAPARPEDRLVIAMTYLMVPVNYLFVALHLYMYYLVFVPVWAFLAMPFLMAIIGQTRGYLTSAAVFHWSTVTCVYNIALIPLLMMVPRWDAPQAGAIGLVFFLVLVTEANDVLQYITGKLLGRHKIMPKVSPNKTWEGFLGGWILTAGLIWGLGPIFTPLTGWGLAIMAFALPLAGFAGDVTFSAIKRDIGVKDTSNFIPGHGGVLDRIDSLTFTAPLYFHLLALFSLSTY